MKCIICKTNTWRKLFRARDRMFGIPGEFVEYECVRCGFMRLSPQPAPKTLQKYYPSTEYYSYKKKVKPSFFGRLRMYLVLHLYEKTLFSRALSLLLKIPAMPSGRPGGRILDVGCGSGDTLSLLQSVGWKCFGLDIDKAAIRVARARGLTGVTYGSYRQISKYPHGYFDAIRLYHVIEHLDDPELCLSLIYKKLKPGGEVILGTPNRASALSKIAKQYWYNLDCPRHLHIFSPKTLSLLLRRNGFTALRVSFGSGGGIVGSIQYVYNDLRHTTVDWVNKPWLIILVYPLEWALDRLRIGDVIGLRAIKEATS